MIYIKNTNTNEIKQLLQIPLNYYGDEKETFTNQNGIKCQRSKLKDEYIILNENDLEVQAIILEEAKKVKKEEFKKIRDLQLEKDSSFRATELKMLGFNDFVEKEEVEFVFPTNNKSSVLLDPYKLLEDVKQHDDENYSIAFSCDIKEVNNLREGFVKIDKSLARNIYNHLRIRVLLLVQLYKSKKQEIYNCKNIEELNNISFLNEDSI